MTNREIMLSALRMQTFPKLKELGFTGKYPNFRRELEHCIELISFQPNKWGGSFTVEVSAVFPDSENKNYTLYDSVTEETLSVAATNKRCRLPGMFDGWFYYRDVYRKRILFEGTHYYDIPEKEAVGFIPPRGYTQVQKFDENAAVQICSELNRQLEQAYRWLKDFEQSNRR